VKTKEASFSVNEIIRENVMLTVTMTGIKAFRVRCWLGAQIIKLAAIVIGCGISVKVEP